MYTFLFGLCLDVNPSLMDSQLSIYSIMYTFLFGLCLDVNPSLTEYYICIISTRRIDSGNQ